MRRVVAVLSVVTFITFGSICRADTKESYKIAVLSLDAEGADLILIVRLKNWKGWCTLSSALYNPRTRREEPLISTTGTCALNVWSESFGSLVEELSKHKPLGEKIRRMHKKAAGLIKDGKYLLAIEVYRMILKTDPGNCNALFGIGLAYEKMGKKPEASNYYDRFRQTCPTFIIEPGDYPAPEEFKRPGDYFIDPEHIRG
jgi:tetratricopeptide (TPR) repeat protein